MPHGWVGKVLRVDLTGKTCTIEPSEPYYSEDEGSDEFFDNPQDTTYNEDDLHQDVTGIIKSKITM